MSGGAIRFALAAYLQPNLLRGVGHNPIPEDALSVIQVAAGDRAMIEECSIAYSIPSQTLKEACALYLRTIIVNAGHDKFRALVLPLGATSVEIKSHGRWLLKWLHPDLNKSAWESALFVRVRQAVKDLENYQYDQFILPQPLNPRHLEKKRNRIHHSSTSKHSKTHFSFSSRKQTFSAVGFRLWFSQQQFKISAAIALIGTSIYFEFDTIFASAQSWWNALFTWLDAT